MSCIQPASHGSSTQHERACSIAYQLHVRTLHSLRKQNSSTNHVTPEAPAGAAACTCFRATQLREPPVLRYFGLAPRLYAQLCLAAMTDALCLPLFRFASNKLPSILQRQYYKARDTNHPKVDASAHPLLSRTDTVLPVHCDLSRRCVSRHQNIQRKNISKERAVREERALTSSQTVGPQSCTHAIHAHACYQA